MTINEVSCKLQGHWVHLRCMIPTLVTGVVVAVGGMKEGIHQLSLGQGSTRREVKGHTPTPTTTIRGEEEEEGEVGEPAAI